MPSFRSLALRARHAQSPRLTVRSYRATPAFRYPYKDTQDRESLKPSRTEGTMSGRDADVATENPDAAFNPSKTSPEAERAAGGTELDISGANQEISKPQGDEKSVNKSRGAGKEVAKGGKSGGGSPPKNGSPP